MVDGKVGVEEDKGEETQQIHLTGVVVGGLGPDNPFGVS